MRRTHRCKRRLRAQAVIRALMFRMVDIPTALVVMRRTERTSIRRPYRAPFVIRRSQPLTTELTRTGYRARAVISLTTSSRRANLKSVQLVMRRSLRARPTTRVTRTAPLATVRIRTNLRPRQNVGHVTRRNKRAHLQGIRCVPLVMHRTTVRSCLRSRARPVTRKRRPAFTGKSKAAVKTVIDLTGRAENFHLRNAQRATQLARCLLSTR